MCCYRVIFIVLLLHLQAAHRFAAATGTQVGVLLVPLPGSGGHRRCVKQCEEDASVPVACCAGPMICVVPNRRVTNASDAQSACAGLPPTELNNGSTARSFDVCSRMQVESGVCGTYRYGGELRTAPAAAVGLWTDNDDSSNNNNNHNPSSPSSSSTRFLTKAHPANVTLTLDSNDDRVTLDSNDDRDRGLSVLWTSDRCDVYSVTASLAVPVSLSTYGWRGRRGLSLVVDAAGGLIVAGGQGSDGAFYADVWRSGGGGAVWRAVAERPNWAARSDFGLVVGDDGILVLAGGQGGGSVVFADVWRSDDGGAVWREVSSAAWGGVGRFAFGMVAAPADSIIYPTGAIVVAGGMDRYSEPLADVWRSADGGASWTTVAERAQWGPRHGFGFVVDTSGATSAMLVLGGAGGASSVSPYTADVWRSVDGGASWTTVAASSAWAPRAYFGVAFDSSGALVLAGGRSDDFYADVWRSVDGGANWQLAAANANWGAGRSDFTMVLDASRRLVVAGGSDGSSFSYEDVWTSGDGGSNWTEVAMMYIWAARTDFGMVMNAAGDLIIACGKSTAAVHQDVWRSTDGGASWQEVRVRAEFGSRFAIGMVLDKAGRIVLVGGQGSLSLVFYPDVWRSHDSGYSWEQITAEAPWSARAGFGIVVDDGGDLVIAGGYDQRDSFSDVWRSTDGGANWTKVVDGAEWQARYSFAMVVDTRGRLVLAGGLTSGHVFRTDVWRSDDGGSKWITLTASAGWSGRAQFGLVVDTKGGLVLAGGTGPQSLLYADVWRSTDGGASWTKVADDAGLSARAGFGFVMDGFGRFVVVGGNTGNLGTLSADVLRFTIVDLYPQPCAVYPPARAVAPHAAFLSGSMLTFSFVASPFATVETVSYGSSTVIYSSLGNASVDLVFGFQLTGAALLIPFGVTAGDSYIWVDDLVAQFTSVSSFDGTSVLKDYSATTGYSVAWVDRLDRPLLDESTNATLMVYGIHCGARRICEIASPPCRISHVLTVQFGLFAVCSDGSLFVRVWDTFESAKWPQIGSISPSVFVPVRSRVGMGFLVAVVGFAQVIVALSDTGYAWDLRAGKPLLTPSHVLSLASSRDITDRVCLVLADGTVGLYAPWQPGYPAYDLLANVTVVAATDFMPYVACTFLPTSGSALRDGFGALLLVRQDGGLDQCNETGFSYVYPRGVRTLPSISRSNVTVYMDSLRLFYGAEPGGVLRYMPCWDLDLRQPLQYDLSQSTPLFPGPSGELVVRAGAELVVREGQCAGPPRTSGALWDRLRLVVSTGQLRETILVNGTFRPCMNVSSHAISGNSELCDVLAPGETGNLVVPRMQSDGFTMDEVLVVFRVTTGAPAQLAVLVVEPQKYGDPIWSVVVGVKDEKGYMTSFDATHDEEHMGLRPRTAYSLVLAVLHLTAIGVSWAPVNTSLSPSDSTVTFRDLSIAGVLAGQTVTLTARILGFDAGTQEWRTLINNTVVNVTQQYCEPVTMSYINVSTSICQPNGCFEMVGLQCNGTERADVLPGYWRTTSGPEGWLSPVDSCGVFRRACFGSVGNTVTVVSDTEGDALCDQQGGHRGVLCGECANGYVMTRTFSCAHCGRMSPLFISLFLIVFVCVVLFLSVLQLRTGVQFGRSNRTAVAILRSQGVHEWPCAEGLHLPRSGVDTCYDGAWEPMEPMLSSGDDANTAMHPHDCGHASSSSSNSPELARGYIKVPLAAFYLKLLVNYLQSSSGVFEAIEQDWPGPIDSMAQLKLHMFQMWDTNSFRCVLSSSYSNRALTTFFLVIGIICVLLAFHSVRKYSPTVYKFLAWWPADRADVWAAKLYTVGNLLIVFGVTALYTVYPSVVSMFVEGLVCVPVASTGSSHLLVDMGVPCRWSSSVFGVGRIFAIAGVVVIGAGFPLGLLVALLVLRRRLFTSSTLVSRLGFLYVGYHARAFYYEPIVLLFRSFGVVVLIARDSMLQLFGLKLVIAAELCTTLILRPYEGASQRLQVFSLSLTLCQLVTATLVVAMPSVVSTGVASFLGTLLLLADVMVIVLFLCEAVGDLLESLGSYSPRIRVALEHVHGSWVSRLLLNFLVSSHDAALREKDAALREKDAALREKDAALQAMRNLLQEKDATMPQL